MSSDEEEDVRISKLVSYYAENDDPSKICEYLEELGGKSGLIYGAMSFNEDLSKSHFLIMAIIHNDSDGKKLTGQIDEAKATLRAWCKTPNNQRGFLLAMELYIVKERRKGIPRFDEVLKKLWENDIVGEEEVEWWHSHENALQPFFPEFNLDDAVALRESAGRFLEWLREGE